MLRGMLLLGILVTSTSRLCQEVAVRQIIPYSRTTVAYPFALSRLIMWGQCKHSAQHLYHLCWRFECSQLCRKD